MTRPRRVRPFSVLPAAALLVALVLWVPATLAAQSDGSWIDNTWTEDDQAPDVLDWSGQVPAHVAVVDGAAWLERDGQRTAVGENTPLLAGDRLHTDRGRLELLFADGSAMDIDAQSTVEVLDQWMLAVEDGRVRLTVARTSTPPSFRLDAAGTTTWLRAPGEYQIVVRTVIQSNPDVVVTTLRGVAEVSTSLGRSVVRSGYEVMASARTTPSQPYAAAAPWDAFEHWASARRDDRTGTASARYLPPSMQYYGGLLDRYGAWAYAAPYGDVWYPRVDAGWSPYSDGAWSFTASFGWFWVGADRWSWPTHHYGRWGRTTADRWFWIPDNRWGPAWVSWASAPGYIGWSPLGFDNRPVIALRSGRAATWRSWTVLSTRTFRPGVFVDVRTRPRSLPAADRFVTHRRAPGRPPGMTAGLGTRGTRGSVVGSAVPRMAVPRTFEAGGRRADVNRPMSPPSRTVLPSTVGRTPYSGWTTGRRAAPSSDQMRPVLPSRPVQPSSRAPSRGSVERTRPGVSSPSRTPSPRPAPRSAAPRAERRGIPPRAAPPAPAPRVEAPRAAPPSRAGSGRPSRAPSVRSRSEGSQPSRPEPSAGSSSSGRSSGSRGAGRAVPRAGRR